MSSLCKYSADSLGRPANVEGLRETCCVVVCAAATVFSVRIHNCMTSSNRLLSMVDFASLFSSSVKKACEPHPLRYVDVRYLSNGGRATYGGAQGRELGGRRKSNATPPNTLPVQQNISRGQATNRN